MNSLARYATGELLAFASRCSPFELVGRKNLDVAEDQIGIDGWGFHVVGGALIRRG